jgi:hypothetical protein
MRCTQLPLTRCWQLRDVLLAPLNLASAARCPCAPEHHHRFCALLFGIWRRAQAVLHVVVATVARLMCRAVDRDFADIEAMVIHTAGGV